MYLTLNQRIEVQLFGKYICFGTWVTDKSLGVQFLSNLHRFLGIDSQFSGC